MIWSDVRVFALLAKANTFRASVRQAITSKMSAKNSGTATTCYSGGGHRAAQCSTSARETEYDEEEEDQRRRGERL